MVSVVLQRLKVLKIHKKAGHDASFFWITTDGSGGTYSGVGPEKEQADDKKHGHTTSSGNKPKWQNTFSPAGAPSHCGASVG
jgi:hypothetical protein